MRYTEPTYESAPKQYEQSKFKKGKITCLVCGKVTDWDCRITEDEGLAYCKYIPNASGKTDIKGRHQHILRARNQEDGVIKVQPVKQNTEIEKANSEKLNEIYSAFLERLTLEEVHLEKLLDERQLSDMTIAYKLYASVPKKAFGDEIAKELSEIFEIEGVPGFYFQNHAWRLNFIQNGFYVPYRNEKAEIVGLQIRKDDNERPKYLWLSSSNKERGSSRGAPLHFVNHVITTKRRKAYITEGALKADIIGEKANVGVIALAGVNIINPVNLSLSISSAFPYLEEIVLAFDMDWKENEEVKKALLSHSITLKDHFKSVQIAIWDRSFGKGLDDALIGSDSPDFLSECVRYVSVEEFQKMCEDVETETIIETTNESGIGNEEKQELAVTEGESKPVVFKEKDIDTFGMTWADFDRIKFDEIEKVMFGLSRGNIGQLIASTNIGKTTLMLNLSISACSNKAFEPLLHGQTVGKRIMYIDGEATKAELQADIRKMIETLSFDEEEMLKSNLCLVCEEELNDEPLD